MIYFGLEIPSPALVAKLKYYSAKVYVLEERFKQWKEEWYRYHSFDFILYSFPGYGSNQTYAVALYTELVCALYVITH